LRTSPQLAAERYRGQMTPSARFDAAVSLAREIHHGQTRKGTDIPYLSHLLAVAGLLMEHRATEDQVIAGLLHDAIEDATTLHGAPVTGEHIEALIRDSFGDDVADIVLDCSDATADGSGTKPPWRARKEKYLAHLAEDASDHAVLVSLADKVHNARAIAQDHDHLGDALWGRFNASSEDTAWYYRRLAEIYARRLPGHPLIHELQIAIERTWGR
jgi:(p)ppGpp synthase/HD superfamily hydrolase